MISIHPTTAEAAAGRPFLQEVRITVGGRDVAVGRWQCGNVAEGVVQIVDLFVDPSHRRQGQATRVLRRMLEEAQGLHQAKKKQVRRAWIAVEQKQQIIARAFLTAMGFHHVATVKNVLRDEDLLVYSKGFD